MDAEVRLVLLHLFAFKSLLAESVQRSFVLCKLCNYVVQQIKFTLCGYKAAGTVITYTLR